MDKERYVAAIEISSSKVIGVVGKVSADGSLELIASDQEKCIESVRRGIIQNVEETATRISRVIGHLEQNPALGHKKINSVFIGLSGQSMRSIAVDVELTFAEETQITADTVKRLRDKALDTAIDSSLEVIDAVPRKYVIGQTVTKEPVGNLGTSIRATYDLIVCLPRLKKNIQHTRLTQRQNIDNRGFIVTQLAAAQLVLTEEEKRLGCMLVDMGAETTSASIYKDGNLVYYATIPLGGRNITRDIVSLNQLEEKAEELKIQSGNAVPKDNVSTLNINGVKFSDVSNLIVARAEEIVVNIVEQINYAGLKDSDLPRGIILTGGGSNLTNIDLLIKDVSKMKSVRKAQLPQYISSKDSKRIDLEMFNAISVLYAGATGSEGECLSVPANEELPADGIPNTDDDGHDTTAYDTGAYTRTKAPRYSRWSGLKKKLTDLFVPSDESESELLDD